MVRKKLDGKETVQSRRDAERLRKRFLKQREKDFQVQFIAFVKSLLGTWVYKTNDLFRVGIPDCLLCYCGLFCAFELKKYGKKPSKLQSVVMDMIRKAGGAVMKVGPEDFEQFKEAFSKGPVYFLAYTKRVYEEDKSRSVLSES